jgi:DNA-directed RNA polymerase subunit M/transcription elongation factor TFIIS
MEKNNETEHIELKCPQCGTVELFSKDQSGLKGPTLTGNFLIATPKLAGLFGSKSLIVTCLKCSHRWKI